MADPIKVRADLEQTAAQQRDAREKQLVADRQDLERQYREDLYNIDRNRIQSLVDAGLESDGTVPPTYDRKIPVNIELPHVSGTPAVGQTITGTIGSWANHPDTYIWRWLRDGGGINDDDGGGGEGTYVVLAKDAGHAISLQIGARNESGGPVEVRSSNALNIPA